MNKIQKLFIVFISSIAFTLPVTSITAAGQDVSELLGATFTFQNSLTSTSYSAVLFDLGSTAFVITPEGSLSLAPLGPLPPGTTLGLTGVSYTDPYSGLPYDAWDYLQGGPLAGLTITIDLSTSIIPSQFTGAFQELAIAPATGPSIAYSNNNQVAQMTWGSGVTASEAIFQFETMAYTSVPEPSTYLVLGTFLALGGLVARKRAYQRS